MASHWRTLTVEQQTQTLNRLHEHLRKEEAIELRSFFPKNVLSDKEIDSGAPLLPHHSPSLLSAKFWRELHTIGLRCMRKFDGYNEQEEKSTTGQRLLVEKRPRKHMEVHLYRHVTQCHWARMRGVRSLAKQEERLVKSLCSRLKVGIGYERLSDGPSFKVQDSRKYQDAVKDQLPIAKAYIDHLLKAPGLPLQKLEFLKKKRVHNQCPSLPHLLAAQSSTFCNDGGGHRRTSGLRCCLWCS